MSRILYKRYKTNVSVDSAWFSSCVKGHGSGGATNHVVVKGPSWFFVVYGPRGLRVWFFQYAAARLAFRVSSFGYLEKPDHETLGPLDP